MRVFRTFLYLLFLIIIISISTVGVHSDNIFEYYFTPEQAENQQTETNDFFDALPEEIKEELPSDITDGSLEDIAETARNYVSFTSVAKRILSEIVSALFPAFQETAVVFGIVLIAALINTLKSSISTPDVSKITDSVINVGIVLSIVSTEMVTVTAMDEFKNLICGLMNGMLPVFGVVYTASGNTSTAVIQSGGMMLLVTVCQNLFSLILVPAVRICIIMSIVGAVFPDTGLRHIMIAFRNVATGIMLSVTTLFSFVLGMQSSIAQSADSLGARSIKFAVGQLVPIIGGAVSDSLGTIGGSLTLLKSAGGTIAIVAIVILLVPTVADLLIQRLSVYLCKIFAAVSGSASAEKLLDDFGAILSMMIAFVVAISIAFIYMLTLFTSSVVAFSV